MRARVGGGAVVLSVVRRGRRRLLGRLRKLMLVAEDPVAEE